MFLLGEFVGYVFGMATKMTKQTDYVVGKRAFVEFRPMMLD